MKLSDAIELGLPEIRFLITTWLLQMPDGTCQGCLAGAALWAQGDREVRENIGTTMAKYWPWTYGWFQEWPCPLATCHRHYDGAGGRQSISSLLTHLASHYERKELSRDEILNSIRSIEPPEPEFAPNPGSMAEEVAELECT